MALESERLLWWWSYGSWVSNYLCNQWLETGRGFLRVLRFIPPIQLTTQI